MNIIDKIYSYSVYNKSMTIKDYMYYFINGRLEHYIVDVLNKLFSSMNTEISIGSKKYVHDRRNKLRRKFK